MRRRARRPPRRLRRRPLLLLRHHPLAYWSTVAVVLVAALAVGRSLEGDDSAATEGLGPLVRVPVARRTIEPGELVAAADVRWRELPAGALADQAVADGFDRRATSTIFAGEPIVASRLAPQGSSELAARVPPGHQAVALPVTVGAPPLEPGDLVDLLRVDAPDRAGVRAQRVARHGVVVDAGTEVVTVAVDDDEVRAVAAATATGAVVIALVGTR